MSRSVWRRARRPEEFVEATRWVFAVVTLSTLLLALPSLLAGNDHTMLPLGVASAAVLGLSWSTGFLRGTAPLRMDVVDAVALLGFAMSSRDPLALVGGLVMPALWFRSLYGSTRRGLTRATLFAGSIIVGIPLWALMPGHTGKTELGVLTGIIPGMFLTVIAGAQLAGGLRARQQAAQRDAVHMSVGSELLGVTQADEIHRIAWTGLTGICAATPGLRVLRVVREGSVLRVDEATGGFINIPASLPERLVSPPVGDGEPGGQSRETVFTEAELDAAVGTRCVWVCKPLPSGHKQRGSVWLLIGAPRKVPDEAIVAVGTLANQVTLALANSTAHENLTLLAELDSLTGLANRASFNAALSADLNDKSPEYSTVLFVDLDDFKDVNDAFGHGAGDDLLREVAARLRRATRPGDLCARLGGDEFAVLLSGTEGAVAVDVARRIVTAVGAPVQVSGGIACVGASIGVATATDESDLEELIHRADVAMYAAKAKGKARVQVFKSGLLGVDTSQVRLQRKLAAAADDGEHIVHYQPVVSLADSAAPQ